MKSNLGRLKQGFPENFLRNVSWQYAATVGVIVVEFLYITLIARELGAANFGLISFGFAFSFLIFQCVDLRLTEVVIRFMSEYMGQERYEAATNFVILSYWVDALTGLVGLLICLGAAWLIVPYIVDDPRAVEIVALNGIFLFFSNISTATSRGVLRVVNKFACQALISFGAVFLKLLIVLFLIVFGNLTVYSAVYAGIAASILASILYYSAVFFYCKQKLDLRWQLPKIKFIHRESKTILHFCKNTYFISLSMLPTKEMDVNLLAYFVSLEVVGVYKVAKNFLSAVWGLIDAVTLAVYPEIAKLLVARRLTELVVFLKKITLGMFVVGVLLYISGYVFIPYMVVILMGEIYDPAGLLFILMSSGLLVWAPFVWLNPLMLSATRAEVITKGGIMGSIFTFISLVIVIPVFQEVGASVVVALSNLFVLASILYFARRTDVVDKLWRRYRSISSVPSMN